jgi:gliding motility-associated-like protein
VVCATDSLLFIVYDTTLQGTFFAPSGLVWHDRPNGVVGVYASVPGSYLVRFDVQGVCSEQFQRTLIVEAPAQPDFELIPPGQREFCISDVFTIAQPDTLGGFFSWVDVQTSGNILALDSVTGFIDLSNSSSGTYDVTYRTNTACQGDTTKRIRVFPNPANALMLLEPKDSICAGDELTITGSGASYFQIRVNGANSSNSNTFTVDDLTNGDTIEVVFITQQLCRDSTDTIITVLPLPDGQWFVPEPTISGNEPMSFFMSSDVDQTSFTWTLTGLGAVEFSNYDDSIPPVALGDSVEIRETADLQFGFDPARAIFLVRPLAYGCYGEVDTVIININPDSSDIFIPEVFTPNGDFKNDTWQIQWDNDIRPQDYTIFVFNRSGGRVYTMNGLREDWAGEDLPDGIYFWNMLEGNTERGKGAVTIRRR